MGAPGGPCTEFFLELVRSPSGLVVALDGDMHEHRVPSVAQLGIVQIGIDAPIASDLCELAVLESE